MCVRARGLCGEYVCVILCACAYLLLHVSMCVCAYDGCAPADSLLPSALNDRLFCHKQGMKGDNMKYKDGSQIKDEECTKDSVYDTKVRGTRPG